MIDINYMYMKLQLYESLKSGVITSKSTHHTWLSEYLIDWLINYWLFNIHLTKGDDTLLFHC